MEIIIGESNIEILRIGVIQRKGNHIFYDKVMEDKEYFYIMDVYGLGIKIGRNTEEGRQIYKIIEKRISAEINIKSDEQIFKELQKFVLNIITVEQLAIYIKEMENKAFEAGRKDKAEEIKMSLNIS